MLQIAWPWCASAILLPLLAAALPRAHPPRGDALRVPFFAHARTWGRHEKRPPLRWPVWLAALAWLCLVSAATRPQWVDEPLTLPLTGRDLMLAVDLSASMDEPDVLLGGSRVARLTAVKHVAGEFIQRRVGDRLGLVLFGTKPYLQAPLTFDRHVVRTLLDEAVIGLAGSSTALGDAVGLAIKRLRDRPATSRVLVLLTDGANNAGTLAPRQAAQLARLHGLRIYAVGFGAGPVGSTQGMVGDLDEVALQHLATVSGGRYFRARDTSELAAIYALIDRLEPVRSDFEQLRPVTELFYVPLTLAVALSVLVMVGALLPRARAFTFDATSGEAVD